MILLVQFRTDQSGPHEIKAVYEAMGRSFDNLQAINARNERITSNGITQAVAAADVVLFGGCGENGYENTSQRDRDDLAVLKNKLEPVVEKIFAEDIPTLGLCFGHQLLADITGGSVGTPDMQKETGVAKLNLTKAGNTDSIFSPLPAPFFGVVGHKASVVSKPNEAVHLAKSGNHKLQALRYGKNVYTTQFHPELSKQDLQDRLKLYPEYKDNSLSIDHEGDLEAKQILEKFLEVYT